MHRHPKAPTNQHHTAAAGPPAHSGYRYVIEIVPIRPEIDSANENVDRNPYDLENSWLYPKCANSLASSLSLESPNMVV